MLTPTLSHPMLPRTRRKGAGDKPGGRCATKARATCTYHQSLVRTLLQTHPFLCPNVPGCIYQIPVPRAGRGCSRAWTRVGYGSSSPPCPSFRILQHAGTADPFSALRLRND